MRQYHNLPANERAALDAIADAQTPQERGEALEAYCKLRAHKRLYQRRRGEDDRWKRTMLAIHVPFEYAQAVTAKAETQGMTVYGWLRKVVDEAMSRP